MSYRLNDRTGRLAACYDSLAMPIARSPADIMCLAVYTLTGGKLRQGKLVTTLAQRLGITLDQAVELTEIAAKKGLIHYEHGASISLTEKGRMRGATLIASAPKES